jgi:hypothetical protein
VVSKPISPRRHIGFDCLDDKTTILHRHILFLRNMSQRFGDGSLQGRACRAASYRICGVSSFICRYIGIFSA